MEATGNFSKSVDKSLATQHDVSFTCVTLVSKMQVKGTG
jgi:hypothetical protein